MRKVKLKWKQCTTRARKTWIRQQYCRRPMSTYYEGQLLGQHSMKIWGEILDELQGVGVDFDEVLHVHHFVHPKLADQMKKWIPVSTPSGGRMLSSLFDIPIYTDPIVPEDEIWMVPKKWTHHPLNQNEIVFQKFNI